jgi:hypothetical protein
MLITINTTIVGAGMAKTGTHIVIEFDAKMIFFSYGLQNEKKVRTFAYENTIKKRRQHTRTADGWSKKSLARQRHEGRTDRQARHRHS